MNAFAVTLPAFEANGTSQIFFIGYALFDFVFRAAILASIFDDFIEFRYCMCMYHSYFTCVRRRFHVQKFVHREIQNLKAAFDIVAGGNKLITVAAWGQLVGVMMPKATTHSIEGSFGV
jgi:hypothetical protein